MRASSRASATSQPSRTRNEDRACRTRSRSRLSLAASRFEMMPPALRSSMSIPARNAANGGMSWVLTHAREARVGGATGGDDPASISK